MSRPFLDVGEGIELHHLESHDAETLQTLIEANRDRLAMWMWWAAGSTIETTRAFIEAAGTDERLDPLGVVVDGELVGVVGSMADAAGDNHEIGYWIAASHEGRGVVTRACSVLITHVFATLGPHRISITAAAPNVRSRAIAERLGFTHEGTRREAGHNVHGYHDLEVYGLLATEWPPS